MIFRCEACGADLNILRNQQIVECEYCGWEQPVPNPESMEQQAQYNRARRLLFRCDFNGASALYESIAAKSPQESEAYWGLVQCRFGVQYVDNPDVNDPNRKTPTLRRLSFTSVTEDPDYQEALTHDAPEKAELHRRRAEELEALRQRAIEIASQEKPYDIFISYKEIGLDGNRTEDSRLAERIYNDLTLEGYRVFFSRVTLANCTEFEREPHIFAALNTARVMIVVGTDFEHFDDTWVRNEWQRYLGLIEAGSDKHLLVCFKDIDPGKDIPKEIRRLQGIDMSTLGFHNILNENLTNMLRGTERSDNKTEMSLNAKLHAAQTALKSGDYKRSEALYQALVGEGAHRYEVWWGLIRSDTHDFTNTKIGEERFQKLCDYKERAFDMASGKIRTSLEPRWNAYQEAYMRQNDEYKQQFEMLRVERDDALGAIQERLDASNAEDCALSDELRQNQEIEIKDYTRHSKGKVIRSVLLRTIITEAIIYFILTNTEIEYRIDNMPSFIHPYLSALLFGGMVVWPIIWIVHGRIRYNRGLKTNQQRKETNAQIMSKHEKKMKEIQRIKAEYSSVKEEYDVKLDLAERKYMYGEN